MKILGNELIVQLNQQIQREYAACHAYWAMEWAFYDLGWKGFACWAHEQASEERHHGKGIANYMLKERAARPQMPMVAASQSFYDMTPLELLQAAAAMEAEMTENINRLYTYAEDFDDGGVCMYAADMLEEQERSEGELAQMVKMLKAADDEGAALILLDEKYKP